MDDALERGDPPLPGVVGEGERRWLGPGRGGRSLGARPERALGAERLRRRGHLGVGLRSDGAPEEVGEAGVLGQVARSRHAPSAACGCRRRRGDRPQCSGIRAGQGTSRRAVRLTRLGAASGQGAQGALVGGVEAAVRHDQHRVARPRLGGDQGGQLGRAGDAMVLAAARDRPRRGPRATSRAWPGGTLPISNTGARTTTSAAASAGPRVSWWTLRRIDQERGSSTAQMRPLDSASAQRGDGLADRRRVMGEVVVDRDAARGAAQLEAAAHAAEARERLGHAGRAAGPRCRAAASAPSALATLYRPGTPSANSPRSDPSAHRPGTASPRRRAGPRAAVRSAPGPRPKRTTGASERRDRPRAPPRSPRRPRPGRWPGTVLTRRRNSRAMLSRSG